MKTVQNNIRQKQKTNERFSLGQDYKQENAGSTFSEYEGDYYDSISSSIETQSVQILPRQKIDKLQGTLKESIARDVNTNNNEYEEDLNKVISNAQGRSLSTGATVEDSDESSQTQTPESNTNDQYYDEGRCSQSLHAHSKFRNFSSKFDEVDIVFFLVMI